MKLNPTTGLIVLATALFCLPNAHMVCFCQNVTIANPSVISNSVQVSSNKLDRINAHLVRDLQSIIDNPLLQSGVDGVIVVDVKSGTTVFAHNPDILLVPASNRKLFTAAAALARLGPDFKEHTEVLAPATGLPTGLPDATYALPYAPTHKRYLVLRGGGDPLLSVDDLDSLATDVAKSGINEVNEIIADDSLFADEGDPWGDGWQADTLLDYYSPEISALEVNEDIATIALRGGVKAGNETTFSVSPSTAYFSVLNTTKTGESGSEVSYTLDRPLGSTLITVSGSIPPNSSPDPNDDNTDGRITIPNPALYAATIFTEKLRDHGVKVGCAPILMPSAPSGLVIASHDSVPLSDLLGKMLKPSDNLVAECLTRLECVVDSSSPSTYSKGKAAEDSWLASVGIGPGTHDFADGSGESRDDFVTADTIVKLLLTMAKRPDFPVFYNALSIVGVDGTAKDRMAGTLASGGNAHVKTGTVRYCRSLSGYVTNRKGEMYAFSILMNNHLLSAHALGLIQDKIVVRLAQEH